jgi:hypothetical protein
MPQDVAGLGLAKAIEAIRSDLLKAAAQGARADIQFPVESLTVELQVVATTGVEGKGGFKVPIVDLELGAAASRQWENTSTVTVVFGAPVDRDGRPVKVTQSTDEEME